MNTKKSVAVIFGGKSVEHKISINSAKNVAEFLDKSAFETIFIYISTDGKWYLTDQINGDYHESDQLLLILDPTRKGFYHINGGKSILPDIVFPVLHGTDGEDGSIQGMLEAVNLPFVGTGVLGSSVSMNKLYSKRLLEAANIPVSNYISYSYNEKHLISYREITDRLQSPFMAKAANLGSSVGVHKVTSEEKFKHALEDIFKFDKTVIFEEFVEGRELECAVMGNDDPQATFPGEIVVSSDYEFYTYDAKYLDPEAAKLQIPAQVSEEIAANIQKLSIQSYKALACEDFARVDLFLKKNGEIIINEINTIPGFTNSSMFPMMWKERGLEFTPLLTKLIELALEKYESSQRLSNNYNP
ncbi:D-alanine--D-alanine ligase family protein [Fulvivirga sediminis]|uniref:D-alanine--D-alanine ligase n=1 Tax=Fulvivirga sediminis TaxID=2803949 RepID=A0A937JZS2_9BACT|nr:D-alanine--D-alanine ligase family protein [Fulvivirga sediminis]MBL3655585.1 D-alanine--D-alanine ligase [Fulvivirga sediminis]